MTLTYGLRPRQLSSPSSLANGTSRIRPNIRICMDSSFPFPKIHGTLLLLLSLLFLLSMLLISWVKDLGMIITIFPYLRVINTRFHLYRSSASSFSSQCVLVFSKSSGAVFFFLLLSQFINCKLFMIISCMNEHRLLRNKHQFFP